MLCQVFSLKQSIAFPSFVTCSTSSVIDQNLTNSTEKILESGIIDPVISNHQLIFCARIVKRVKFNKHNNVLLRKFV